MTEKFEVENIVVGAGVIGLAVAAEMSRSGLEVYVLEREDKIGSGISSRNSEVIHSGVYYPANSLRARFCVEGRKKLYTYCQENDISFMRCGKLIVATTKEEVSKLELIKISGNNNAVGEIYFLNEAETLKKSPQIKAVSSLFIPETGIIDSHSYMKSLEKEVENSGGKVLLNHSFINGVAEPNKFTISVKTKSEIFQVYSKRLVIAAGLFTHQLCGKLEGYDIDRIPKLHLAKGNYFSYNGPDKFEHLIYPIPVVGGLGTHLTFDMTGAIRFGPDVEWIESSNPEEINFEVSQCREDLFYESIRRYWPKFPENSLSPAYSGVRPKLSGKTEGALDFLIDDCNHHGVPGLAILFGIESPGLTSSLAIGEYIAQVINY